PPACQQRQHPPYRPPWPCRPSSPSLELPALEPKVLPLARIFRIIQYVPGPPQPDRGNRPQLGGLLVVRRHLLAQRLGDGQPRLGPIAPTDRHLAGGREGRWPVDGSAGQRGGQRGAGQLPVARVQVQISEDIYVIDQASAITDEAQREADALDLILLVHVMSYRLMAGGAYTPVVPPIEQSAAAVRFQTPIP